MEETFRKFVVHHKKPYLNDKNGENFFLNYYFNIGGIISYLLNQSYVNKQ